MDFAAGLCIRLPRDRASNTTIAKREQLFMTVKAMESTLPPGSLKEPMAWISETVMVGSYDLPSTAMNVLLGTCDLHPKAFIRVGLALGEHFPDRITVDGETVPSVALARSKRAMQGALKLSRNWINVEGFGDLDILATTALSLTINIRQSRTPTMHEAAMLYLSTYDVDETQAAFNRKTRAGMIRRVRRTQAAEVERIEAAMGAALDQMARDLQSSGLLNRVIQPRFAIKTWDQVSANKRAAMQGTTGKGPGVNGGP